MGADVSPWIPAAAALPGGAREDVFRDPLEGPSLAPEWQWVREELADWLFGSGGVEVAARQGGPPVPGLGASPLLLRPLAGAEGCEVVILMPPAAAGGALQAGLVWRLDDSNYITLVVECAGAGGTKAVMAKVRGDCATVAGSLPLEDLASRPVLLRLSLSADGAQMTGTLIGPGGECGVGHCLAGCAWGNSAPELQPSVGVCVRGGATGCAPSRAVRFSDFTGVAPPAGCTAAPPPRLEAPAGAPEAPPTPAEDPGWSGEGGGWTMSRNLPEAELRRIQELLVQNGLLAPPLTPSGPGPPPRGRSRSPTQ